MSALIGILFLVFVVPYLARQVSAARNRPWTGPRTPAMRGRTAAAARSPRIQGRMPAGRSVRAAAASAGTAVLHPRSGHIRAQARADIDRLVAETGLTDWLEENRARRDLEAKAEEDVREARRAAAAAPPPPASSPPQGHPAATRPPPGALPGWKPSAAAQGPAASAPPAQPPPGTSGSNGGTPVAAGTSTAGAEQIIEAIDRLAARAMAGNILTKREVMLAFHEALTRGAIAMTGLSRDMAEPGSNYGPEITEPLAKAGTQAQAAAMCLADADAALVALLTKSVGEMATSSQQTPHHRNELSESGAR